MITQGTNWPLVIGLKFDASEASEIHVGLYDSTGEIMHKREDELVVSSDGKALIVPLTQAETISMPAGRLYCTVKALVNGVPQLQKKMPVSVGAYLDKDIMGDDEPITEYDYFYTGDLVEPQGILNPESIRTAIVIRAGEVTDEQAQTVITNYLTAHASEIKGPKGDPGAAGSPGANGKSAYQLAVEAGYTGTQAEWLASLKGAKGDPGTDGDDYVLTQDDKDEIADMAADRITVPVKVSDLLNDSGYITSSAISGKVDKIAGKGLSTNDYDATAKAKVDAIPSNPKYTDTVYDDTQIKQDIAALQTGKANATHSHAIADVTGLQAVVDKVNAMYPDYTSALALLGGDS